MVNIVESGMEFGPFEDGDVFYIEKSKIYQKIQQNMQMAEFVVTMRNNSIWIVEAKSSSPNPRNKESEVSFDEYITEISNKLLNALTLTVSVVLNRHDNGTDEILPNVRKGIVGGHAIKLCLIIKGHNEEWLIPIQDALNQQLYLNKKIWKFDIAVMNDNIARTQKLISYM